MGKADERDDQVARSPSPELTSAPHIAIAPVAKLMTPVPRYVTMIPMAIAAYNVPMPNPNEGKCEVVAHDNQP